MYECILLIILNVCMPANHSSFSFVLFMFTDLFVTPAEHSGPYGQDYVFECIAKANVGPVPTLEWRLDDNPETIKNLAGEYSLIYTQDDSFSARSSLTILNAQENDNGIYICSSPNQGVLGTFEGSLEAYQHYGNGKNLCCFLSRLNYVQEEI